MKTLIELAVDSVVCSITGKRSKMRNDLKSPLRNRETLHLLPRERLLRIRSRATTVALMRSKRIISDELPCKVHQSSTERASALKAVTATMTVSADRYRAHRTAPWVTCRGVRHHHRRAADPVTRRLAALRKFQRASSRYRHRRRKRHQRTEEISVD